LLVRRRRRDDGRSECMYGERERERALKNTL
jgi:hypothetical protein